jgi:drug/metabolite transporter (DMT)-like permease
LEEENGNLSEISGFVRLSNTSSSSVYPSLFTTEQNLFWEYAVKPKHWFVFILLGAIWSSSFMWIKIAVQEVGPITLVAFRVLFGLLFGIAVILVRRVSLPRTFKEWTPLLVLGITNISIPFFLISWGEQSIDSAVASILDATVPLFTILIAHYLLRDDKMTVPKVLGLLLGFAGVVILMSRDIGDSLGSVLGQLAVVLASVFYAGSAVYARRTFLVESPVKIPQLGITWIALLFLGILGSGVAFILAYYLIHEIGPTRTSMVTYLFPLGGVILGVVFLDEQLSWQLVVGALLIVLSLGVANFQSQKHGQTVKQGATD